MGMDDGGIGRRLWINCRRESLLCAYTPFFLSLASAHLDSEWFLHCVSHDLHFCRAFMKAYKMAEECADDEDEKSELRKLRRSVKDKLNNYHSLVREWGFELTEESAMDVSAVKYIDFLLATASGKIEGEKAPVNIATPFEWTKVAAYTLAAMTPCLRLYTFICQEINRLLNPDDNTHVYKKWINHYSSPDFEASALQIEEMLEKLSISLTSEELELIEKIYHQAMKLQVNFFSNLPVGGRTIIPLYQEKATAIGDLIIFCDFDMTCSFVDSCAMMAEIAILTAPKSDSSGSETQLARMSSADLRNTWAVLTAQYAREFDQCVESIVTGEKGTFNYDSLSKALEQLADFEKSANLRVIESGVLKGINLDDIKRAGQRLIIRDGCKEFFQKIDDNENLNAEVHVLSYCWCGHLIRSAFSSADVGAVNVHSNELAYEESVSTGDLINRMESPMEKVHRFYDILNDHPSDGHNLTIYVGGSVGDLLCLLKADIGIVIGTSPSLRKLGDHFGVTFVPLFSGLVKRQKELGTDGSLDWNQTPGVLYTVSDWAEIQALVIGS